MSNPIPLKCDVLVLGTGLAGLYFALQLAEMDPSVDMVLLTKGFVDECNTVHAQGGIAAVMQQGSDRFDKHLSDTMRSGNYKGDEGVTERFVKDIPACIRDLLRYGVGFDQKDGGYSLHLEGGHTEPRVLHVKDHTGLSVHRVLMNQLKNHPNIKIYDHCLVTELIIGEDESGIRTFKGAQIYIESENCLSEISANAVMLATGGSGALFRYTTNPDSAAGDGVALALKAGLTLKDMKYYQFHPTALYNANSDASLFLLTEALRGEGAYLCNEEGQRFVFRYDARGELASRDIVSHAIREELFKSGREYVYLDMRHLNTNEIENKFPSVCKVLNASGYRIERDRIPVLPAAHYQCGGILCDENAYTGLKGVYVSGELASTGIHGTNRLASNSLAEALVFSKRAAKDMCRKKIYSNRLKDIELKIIHCKKTSPELIAQTEHLRKKLKADLSSLFDLCRKDTFEKELASNLKMAKELCLVCKNEGLYSKEVIELTNAAAVVQVIFDEFKLSGSKGEVQGKSDKVLI
jgi:L-aspartate oxidase